MVTVMDLHVSASDVVNTIYAAVIVEKNNHNGLVGKGDWLVGRLLTCLVQVNLVYLVSDVLYNSS